MSTSGSTSLPPLPEDTSSEASLFHPPRDLICPITQNLFVDPVVNSVGQIYERQAFLSYLERSHEKNDPVTRQKVDENVLTSIYAVKARASDYREETARKCVELASQNDAVTALKYLKRAAELCSEADILVRLLKNAGCLTEISRCLDWEMKQFRGFYASRTIQAMRQQF